MKKWQDKPYILWFNEIGIDDVALVGGKNASLGEMYQYLQKKKVQIPNGFTITSHAYKYFLESQGVLRDLRAALYRLNPLDTRALEKAGKKVRAILLNCELPSDLQEAILSAYHELSSKYKTKMLDVAVRSSATAEDLPTASFAGQQETFLNVSGEQSLLTACKKCFASLFTNRAIAYRHEHKIDHFSVSLSIGIQKMVRSDLGSSGVIFTLDPESGFPDVVLITGSYGLGESIVQGMVNTDEFYVFKPTFRKGYQSLISKKLGSKLSKMVYSKEIDHSIETVETTLKDRSQFCIADFDVFQLAKWALEIEDYYSKKYGKWTPMDIEWAKDGQTGELYILQARPETVQSRRDVNIIESYTILQEGKVLTTGKSVGSKIGQGSARVIHEIKDMQEFKKGEVLVTDITDPDWVPIMRIASAIVTNRGGRTSHAAIVSRELGLPCIVGTNNGTQVIKTGSPITVDCSMEGRGVVYEGLLAFKVSKVNTRKIPSPKTQVMMNIGYPNEAFHLSLLPNDGVGLAREEFIISEYIRIHPMALIDFERVTDPKIRKQIEEITAGYVDKKQFFIDRLAMGIATIAAAFYPRDVILRFSDFKTNEYVNLIGGKYFEPKEENPMIGWRGASRYYHKDYQEGFALECKAIRKVRDEMGLVNIKVMIPVCRTPEEGKKVLKVMKKYGLVQGQNGLEVYMMCEVPSNVILAEQFCDIFDGLSIGTNDLTQMVLGVDRDSELVSNIYDERHEAVLRMIKQVIQVARKKKCKIGICGDAPSTYPEFTQFLVDCGINSISLSPDSLIKMRSLVARYEKSKKRK